MYSLVAVAFFKKYKKIILWVAFFLGTFLAGFFLSKSFWQSPLKDQINEYELIVAKSNERILQAEIDAKETAKKNKEKMKDLENNLSEISSAYEEEKKKKKVVKVQIPGEKIEVPIYIDSKNNSYYCDRFGSDFLDSVNNMIDETNKKIGE